MGVHQGADLRRRRGPQEPRADAGSDRPAAGQGEVLQEADRGGRGDRRPQPGQVPQGGRSPRRRRSERRCQRAGNGNEEGPCQVRLPWSLRSQQKRLTTWNHENRPETMKNQHRAPLVFKKPAAEKTDNPSTNSHFPSKFTILLICGASHSCILVNEINLELT